MRGWGRGEGGEGRAGRSVGVEGEGQGGKTSGWDGGENACRERVPCPSVVGEFEPVHIGNWNESDLRTRGCDDEEQIRLWERAGCRRGNLTNTLVDTGQREMEVSGDDQWVVSPG